MARKFGKTYRISTNFYDYNYVINGVGGIGKTTMAYELGKIASGGNNEGTFIVTCGTEPEPGHIPDAFGDVAKTYDQFIEIVTDLCDNKVEYPATKFVAIDSLDEFFRIAEDYVVREWNNICKKNGDLASVAKSISQAYKGFQKGENRVVDITLKMINKLTDAGYRMIYLGHTKTKAKEDIITGVKYEQLTCNLDNKYYNAIKDKVNLVAMCYFENQIENIKDVKNAFTKEMERKGDLVSKKRVMLFVDDDNAIDTKSHFEYIVNKADFGAENLVKAVEDAINEKIKAPSGSHKSPEHVEMQRQYVEQPVKDIVETNDFPEDDSESPYDVDAVANASDKTDRISKIKTSFAASGVEVKKKIKAILTEKGSGKLDESIEDSVLDEIEAILF